MAVILLIELLVTSSLPVSFAGSVTVAPPPATGAAPALPEPAPAPLIVQSTPTYNLLLQDDSTGNMLRWNSTISEYFYGRCYDGFTLTGTGTVVDPGSTCTPLTEPRLKVGRIRMRRKPALRLTVSLLSLISWIAFQPEAAHAQGGGFTISPVVMRGNPKMDGGTFSDFDFCNAHIAGEHGLSDLGQVVIAGWVVNCTTGVYVVTERTGFPVADTCHPTHFCRLALYAGINLNNCGQVALNMGQEVGSPIVDMIRLYSDLISRFDSRGRMQSYRCKRATHKVTSSTEKTGSDSDTP